MSGSQPTDAPWNELLEFFHSDESLSEDELREILERFGCAPNNNLNIDNYGFFIMACHNDLVTEEIIRCLLEYFPDAAGYTSTEGLLTPLHSILCVNKNVTRGIVQLLIDACPESIDRANNEGNTPLHHLCNNKQLHDTAAVDILGFFLERYPEAVRHTETNGALPIQLAAGQGSKSPEFCSMLIEAYPGSERMADSNRTLPFHIACGIGRVATAEYLYQLDPESINVTDGGGAYPIHHAIMRLKSGNPATSIEMVQFLLDCDLNVASLKMLEIFSPLFMVCVLEHSGVNVAPIMSVVLKVLHLLYDAYPEAIEDNAIEGFLDGFPEEIQSFVNSQLTYAHQARDSTLMNTPDVNGQLPLHSALCDNVSLGSMKLLVKGNRDAVRVSDHCGWLPLHLAILNYDSTTVVDYFVGLDSNTLTAVDMGGNTALHYACRCAKYDTIVLLLEKYDAVSVSKTNGHNKLPIHLLLESNANSREGDTKYTESIFRLLRAYPDTVMM